MDHYNFFFLLVSQGLQTPYPLPPPFQRFLKDLPVSPKNMTIFSQMTKSIWDLMDKALGALCFLCMRV